MFAIAVLFSASMYGQKKDSVQVLNEVSIASKMKQNRKEIGKNVSVLTSEDLDKLQGMSLENVLNSQMGIQINGSFSNPTQPKTYTIRGGRNKNVLILIDDVPLKEVTGNDYTSFDIRNLQIGNIASIEILNGSSSVLYGSNATASVISIKTKKDTEKIVNIQFDTSVSSFDTYKQGLSINGKSNGFHYSLSGNNSKSQSFSSAKDKVNIGNFDDDGFEKQNIHSQFGYEYAKGDISLDFAWNHLLFKYDDYEFADGKNKGDNTTNYFGLNWKHNYSFGSLNVNTRQSNSRNEFMSWNTNAYKTNNLYKGKSFFGEVFNNFQINKNLDVTAGVQYENQKLDYSGNVGFSNPIFTKLLDSDSIKTNTLDGFIQAKAKFSIFNIVAGARLNTHSNYNSKFTYSINPFVLFNLKEHQLKIGGSISSAYNAPTLYQLHGENQYVNGNSNLIPEEITSYEADVAFFSKENNFDVQFSLFYRDEKEVFQYITDPISYKGSYINVAQSYAKGFEIGLNYRINSKIKFSSNFSFVERDTDLGMLRIPKQKWNNAVELSIFKGNSIVLSHLFTSTKQDVFYNDQTYSSEYIINSSFHLFNIFVQQKITKNLSFFASSQNIFNTTYVEIIGYNEQPRIWELGLKINF